MLIIISIIQSTNILYSSKYNLFISNVELYYNPIIPEVQHNINASIQKCFKKSNGELREIGENVLKVLYPQENKRVSIKESDNES